jgi:hypothetical protein
MKSKVIVCAIAAASLGFGSLSFAQGYDQRRNDDQRYEQRGDQYWRHEQQQASRGWQVQGPQPRFDNRDQRYAQRGQNERSSYGSEQRVNLQQAYGQPAYYGEVQPTYIQQGYQQPTAYSVGNAVPVAAEVALGVIAVGLIGQLLANH